MIDTAIPVTNVTKTVLTFLVSNQTVTTRMRVKRAPKNKEAIWLVGVIQSNQLKKFMSNSLLPLLVIFVISYLITMISLINLPLHDHFIPGFHIFDLLFSWKKCAVTYVLHALNSFMISMSFPWLVNKVIQRLKNDMMFCLDCGFLISDNIPF